MTGRKLVSTEYNALFQSGKPDTYQTEIRIQYNLSFNVKILLLFHKYSFLFVPLFPLQIKEMSLGTHFPFKNY